MIFIIVVFCLAVAIGLGWLGYVMCSHNNIFGLIPLFIGLNFLGLLFGICILYSKKNSIAANQSNQQNVDESNIKDITEVKVEKVED